MIRTNSMNGWCDNFYERRKARVHCMKNNNRLTKSINIYTIDRIRLNWWTNAYLNGTVIDVIKEEEKQNEEAKEKKTSWLHEFQNEKRRTKQTNKKFDDKKISETNTVNWRTKEKQTENHSHVGIKVGAEETESKINGSIKLQRDKHHDEFGTKSLWSKLCPHFLYI